MGDWHGQDGHFCPGAGDARAHPGDAVAQIWKSDSGRNADPVWWECKGGECAGNFSLSRCRRRAGGRGIAAGGGIPDDHPVVEIRTRGNMMTGRNTPMLAAAGKLIYDIGANDGADTAYYLQRGFSVGAIEADPSLCAALRARFASEITRGMVIVVNAAVMEEDREAVALYVSGDNTESSLIRSMAERAGPAAQQLLVRGRCLCSLFSEYGLPWYCKIDIEGYDASAVIGMSG